MGVRSPWLLPFSCGSPIGPISAISSRRESTEPDGRKPITLLTYNREMYRVIVRPQSAPTKGN